MGTFSWGSGSVCLVFLKQAMRICFDLACLWGIVILEIRPKFWGGGLKNRGLQKQSAYCGRKLPCSFKKRMGHLLNKRNEETNQKNPSNVDLMVFKNKCFCDALKLCPEWGGIFEVPPGGEENLGNQAWNCVREKAGWEASNGRMRQLFLHRASGCIR